MNIDMFDRVRIKESEETKNLGLDGQIGVVYGITTPSVTGINASKIIGVVKNDLAIQVQCEDTDAAYWFADHLIEFVDYAAGTVITVGDYKQVRNSNGTWTELHTSPKKKWWHFWK